MINGLVTSNSLDTVLEFGCGDGNQLSYYSLQNYLGLDVAEKAVELCSEKFADDPSKRFRLIRPGEDVDFGRFDLVMSLEVLMHVVDEGDFLWTLDNIFRHSDNYVVILTPLTPLMDFPKGSHEKYRNLFPYLVPYIGEFAVVDVITHPSVTPEGRRRRRSER